MLRAVLAVLLLSAAPALAQDIMIEDPYAITPVPGAPSGGAYMVIRNGGAAPDRLVGARSPVAAHVMLHTHEEVDGVIRMRAAEDGLDLPAGGTLRLGRGEAHVMFMGITDPFEDGDLIPLTLVFETAGEIAVEVPVDLSRATEDPAAEGHGAHAPGDDAQSRSNLAHDDHGSAAHEGH
jgi:copper(I)-binding protein